MLNFKQNVNKATFKLQPPSRKATAIVLCYRIMSCTNKVIQTRSSSSVNTSFNNNNSFSSNSDSSGNSSLNGNSDFYNAVANVASTWNKTTHQTNKARARVFNLTHARVFVRKPLWRHSGACVRACVSQATSATWFSLRVMFRSFLNNVRFALCGL